MERKQGARLISLFLLLLLLSACKSQPPGQDPSSFTANFASSVSSGDEDTLRGYKGGTYQLNAVAGSISHDEYIHIQCSDNAGVCVYLPQDELNSLSSGDVIALEGTVTEVDVKTHGGMTYAEMKMEPAHILERTFVVTGEVEEIFHDWNRDGQDYAAVWNSNVVQDRQINIYLPDGHGLQVGDTLTARGALLAPSNLEEFSVAYIRGRGMPTVFVMLEPDSVQKGGL